MDLDSKGSGAAAKDVSASTLAVPPVPRHLTLRLAQLENGPRDAITKEMSAWIDAYVPQLRKTPDSLQAQDAVKRLVTEHSLRYSDHPDKLVSSLLLALRDPDSPDRLPPASFEGFLRALLPELEVDLIDRDTFDSIARGVPQGLKGLANLADLASTFTAAIRTAQEEASSRASFLPEFIEWIQKLPLFAPPVPSSSPSTSSWSDRSTDDKSAKLVLKRRRDDDDHRAVLHFDTPKDSELDQESLGAHLINEQRRMPTLDGLRDLVCEWLDYVPSTPVTIAAAFDSLTVAGLRRPGWTLVMDSIAKEWSGANMPDDQLSACIKGILLAIDNESVSEQHGLDLGRALRASIGRHPKAPGLVADYVPKTAGLIVFMARLQALLEA